MVPDKVSFTDFVVEDPRAIIFSHQTNSCSFWPDDWSIIPEPKSNKSIFEPVSYYPWLTRNCEHRWEIVNDFTGSRLFAFEDDGEAALFLLTF